MSTHPSLSKTLRDKIVAQLGSNLEKRLSAAAERLATNKYGKPTKYSDLPSLNLGALLTRMPGQTAGRDMEKVIGDVLAALGASYIHTPKASAHDLAPLAPGHFPVEVKFARGSVRDGAGVNVYSHLRFEDDDKLFVLVNIRPGAQIFSGRSLLSSLEFRLAYASELKMASGKDEYVTALTLNVEGGVDQKYGMLLEETRSGDIHWFINHILNFLTF